MRAFFDRYIFTRSFGEHTFSLITIIVLTYLGKDFIIFFLTAFLCGYLFQEISRWSQVKLEHIATKAPKLLQKFLTWLSKEKVMITVYYALFAVIFLFAVRDIGPAIIADMIRLLQSLSQKFSIDLGINNLQDTLSHWQSIGYQLSGLLDAISPSTDTRTLFAQLLQIGSIFFQVVFAYLLSYIWLLEYEKVQTYFSQLKKSPFAFLYNDLQLIFGKITKSFGLVFQAQSQIALANTVLTVLGILIIGIIFGQLSPDKNILFPYVLALGFITFLSSFIPILGVFLGGIPILFAGITGYPGWGIIVAIIGMLFVIHTIEGYFLNPRLVGKSLNLPAPMIFIILFFSEHLMGIAGFFLGVPLYLLCIEMLTTLGRRLKQEEQKI